MKFHKMIIFKTTKKCIENRIITQKNESISKDILLTEL